MGRRPSHGFTLIELLIAVALIGILAVIAIPNLLSAKRRSDYCRAAADTRIAVAQAIVYAGDRGVYPRSISVIRETLLIGLRDQDPWNAPYVLSPSLTEGRPPGNIDDVHIYSKGAAGTGTYPVPFVSDSGSGGSVGYSTAYGAWAGS